MHRQDGNLGRGALMGCAASNDGSNDKRRMMEAAEPVLEARVMLAWRNLGARPKRWQLMLPTINNIKCNGFKNTVGRGVNK